MDELVLGPMRPGAVRRCAELGASLPLLQRYGMDVAAITAALEGALQGGRADLLVAERAGEAVGFAWFVPRGAFDRSGYLRLIAVAEGAQGRGVGARLMEELEARHLAQGGIVLLASDFNVRAHRFYERLGYRLVGEIPGYARPGIAERLYYKPPPPG